MKKVCIVPRMDAGGPGTFRRNVEAGLARRDIGVTHEPTDSEIDAFLVINLVPRLWNLYEIARSSVRIVQRLGSPHILNSYLPQTLGRKVRSKAVQYLTVFMRKRIAHHVIYQSSFVKDRWDARHGQTGRPVSVIHNGVDIEKFRPIGHNMMTLDKCTILSVEGSQGADPFDIAISFGEELYRKRKDFKIVMLGKPRFGIAKRVQRYPFISFVGEVRRDDLLSHYARADLFLSTDIIGVGCPNSVIEALACGIPVIGYRLGVLPEVVSSDAGRCVVAKGDPWKGEHPGNVSGLVEAAEEVLGSLNRFRIGARSLAERRYSLDCMVDEYVEFLFQ